MVCLGDFIERFTFLDYREQNFHEVLQRILIQEVNRRHTVQGEEHPRSHDSEWNVLFCDLFDLMHSLVSLGYLVRDFFGFALEGLQSLN